MVDRLSAARGERTMRVISRAAVASFKGGLAELPRMAKELGIGSVVTGTVREDASRVRVNVELIEANSGQVIWSEQYDREGVDVTAVACSTSASA